MCTSQIISIFFFDLFAHNIAIVSGAKIKTLEIMKHYHTYNAYYINWNGIIKKNEKMHALSSSLTPNIYCIQRMEKVKSCLKAEIFERLFHFISSNYNIYWRVTWAPSIRHLTPAECICTPEEYNCFFIVLVNAYILCTPTLCLWYCDVFIDHYFNNSNGFHLNNFLLQYRFQLSSNLFQHCKRIDYFWTITNFPPNVSSQTIIENFIKNFSLKHGRKCAFSIWAPSTISSNLH